MILARDIRRNAWIVAVAVAFPAPELISAADVDVLRVVAEVVARDCPRAKKHRAAVHQS